MNRQHNYLTVLAGLVTLPLSILMLCIVLHIPVLSVPAYRLIPYLPRVLIVQGLFTAGAWLLFHRRRGKAEKTVFLLTAAGFLAGLLIGISELAVAGQAHAAVDFSAAFENSDGDLTYDGDVTYMTYEGRDYALSVWLPQNTEENLCPILLWVHGGSWISGTRQEAAPHCRYFAEHGYLVVSAEYPLSTEETHLYTAQQGALAKAIQWLKYNAASLHGDVNRLYLGGSSAGGNLAIAVAARANKGELDAILGDALPKIRAVSACCPPVDPSAVYDGCDPVFRRWIHSVCFLNWGGSPQEVPERYLESNASYLADENMAPTLMLYGRLDHLIPASSYKSFLKRMAELDVDTSAIAFPFSDHGCDVSGTVECQVWRQKTLEWFEQHR